MTATLTPGTTTPPTGIPSSPWEELNDTGRRLYGAGDLPGAEQAFESAIAAAENAQSVDPLRLASSVSNLAQIKYQQKDAERAEALFRRALELREGVLGAEHPTVVTSINNLAALYIARGALDEAEPLLLRAMGATSRRIEAAQGDLTVNLNNLVRLYFKRGAYAQAEPLLLQLLAIKRPLGAEHPEVATVLVSLAKLRLVLQRPEAAERLWRRVLTMRERSLPPGDVGILAALDGLAETYAAMNRPGDELSMRKRAFEIREQSFGANHPSLEAARARITELRALASPQSPALQELEIVTPVDVPRLDPVAMPELLEVEPPAPPANGDAPIASTEPAAPRISQPTPRISQPAQVGAALMPPAISQPVERISAPIPRVSGPTVPRRSEALPVIEEAELVKPLPIVPPLIREQFSDLNRSAPDRPETKSRTKLWVTILVCLALVGAAVVYFGQDIMSLMQTSGSHTTAPPIHPHQPAQQTSGIESVPKAPSTSTPSATTPTAAAPPSPASPPPSSQQASASAHPTGTAHNSPARATHTHSTTVETTPTPDTETIAPPPPPPGINVDSTAPKSDSASGGTAAQP